MNLLSLFLQPTIIGHKAIFHTQNHGVSFYCPWPQWDYSCSKWLIQVPTGHLACSGSSSLVRLMLLTWRPCVLCPVLSVCKKSKCLTSNLSKDVCMALPYLLRVPYCATTVQYGVSIYGLTAGGRIESPRNLAPSKYTVSYISIYLDVRIYVGKLLLIRGLFGCIGPMDVCA